MEMLSLWTKVTIRFGLITELIFKIGTLSGIFVALCHYQYLVSLLAYFQIGYRMITTICQSNRHTLSSQLFSFL